jgi:hypothetical protein
MKKKVKIKTADIAKRLVQYFPGAQLDDDCLIFTNFDRLAFELAVGLEGLEKTVYSFVANDQENFGSRFARDVRAARDTLVLEFCSNIVHRDLRRARFYLQVESILPVDSSRLLSFEPPAQNAQLSNPGSGFTSCEFVLVINFQLEELVEKSNDVFIWYEPECIFLRREQQIQDVITNIEGLDNRSMHLHSATLVIQREQGYTRCDLIVLGENGIQTITFNTNKIDITFLGWLYV